MRFQCQHCQQIVSIDDTECGQPVGCGHCGNVTIVPQTRVSPGALINDFIIQETLGSGGMGTVYLAHQVSLDRTVALKILMEQFSRNGEFINDFVREARAAARLNHPNIVQSYAVGEDDGIYFFAMECVEGRTLSDILQEEGKLPWKRAFGIIQQIGEALDFAWKNQQLVHRDIKPDNIMMTERGVAKLADLGLARAAHETLDDDDEVMGTPQYICPEQLLGQHMDVRGDIYSLGATLFHALTGNFPFEGNSAAEIARKHLKEPLADLRSFDKSIPGSANYVVQKMMAKKLEDRYEDAEELVMDLQFVLRGQNPAGYKSSGNSKRKTHRGKTKVGLKKTSTGKVKGRTRTRRGTKGSFNQTNRKRKGTAGRSKHGADAPEVMAPPAQETQSAEPGGGKTMSVKKTGKIKVSAKKKRVTTGGSASNSRASSSYRPPGAPPAKKGGGGKVAVIFLLVVILVLGGLITWFLIQTNKYNFKTPADAKRLYLAEKVATSDERQDYLDLEIYLDPQKEIVGEEAEEAYRMATQFLEDHPTSLFSNHAPADLESRTKFYVTQYKVPLGIPFFVRNIHPQAKGWAGIVRKQRDGHLAEKYVRYLRSKDWEIEKKMRDTNLAEYEFQQLKTEVLDELDLYVEDMVTKYRSEKDRFQNIVNANEETWKQERSEVRDKILEFTKGVVRSMEEGLRFPEALAYLKKAELDMSRYDNRVESPIRNFLRESAVEKARPKLRELRRKIEVYDNELGQVQQWKQELDLDEFENRFQRLRTEKGLAEVEREISALIGAEQRILERERNGWFAGHKEALALATKYNNLVANRLGDLPKYFMSGPHRKLKRRRVDRDLDGYRWRKAPYQHGDKVTINSLLRYGLVVTIHRDTKEGRMVPVGQETIPYFDLMKLGFFYKLAGHAWAEQGGAGARLKAMQAAHDFYVRPDDSVTSRRLDRYSTDPTIKFLLDELGLMLK